MCYFRYVGATTIGVTALGITAIGIMTLNKTAHSIRLSTATQSVKITRIKTLSITIFTTRTLSIIAPSMITL